MTRIPTDGEATLPRARQEAAALLTRGAGSVGIYRAKLKLPSGITGERFFCLDPTTLALAGSGTATLVETISPPLAEETHR